jgi:hypothetical protein
VEAAGVTLVEGLSYYRAIQPIVAGADAAADRSVVGFYTSDPATLTVAMRDAALAALNRAATALLLTPNDLVSPEMYS